MNLGHALKSLEDFLLTDPTDFPDNWALKSRYPDGSSYSLEAGIGVVNSDEFDPFSPDCDLWKPRHMMMVQCHWTPGFLDKGEKPEIVSRVEMAAREWCKRLHDWHGSDDNETDFLAFTQFDVTVTENGVVAVFDLAETAREAVA